MSIVLSHKTSWLVFHSPKRPDAMERLPDSLAPLQPAYPSKGEVSRALAYLRLLEIPEEELAIVDLLVANDRMRPDDRRVRSHICSAPLPAGSVLRIAPGLYVAGPELSFVQMAGAFEDCREAVEYGFELCGSYELGFDALEEYRSRLPLTTRRRLGRVLDGLRRVRGVRAARWALQYVREGSRSPMETAHVMTLVLPRRFGGLGIRGVQMDYRIDIPAELRALTRTRYVVCDGFVSRARLDIEYNGFYHDEEQRKASDEERRNVLEAMGYHVKTLNRAAFFDERSFRRHLEAVARIARIQTKDLDEKFWQRAEELRQFVLRRWLE